MKKYDLGKLKTDLQALNKKLEGHEKTAIAALEHCSTMTIQRYLKGDITVPSLADAIVKRANELIKQRA